MPIQSPAIRIRKKEDSIGFRSKSLSLVFNIKKRIKQVLIPDMEVAKANPFNFRGNIRMTFKIIFTIKAKKETLAGVQVSFKAKKQDCSILVRP